MEGNPNYSSLQTSRGVSEAEVGVGGEQPGGFNAPPRHNRQRNAARAANAANLFLLLRHHDGFWQLLMLLQASSDSDKLG